MAGMAVTRSMLRDQIKDALVERILDGVYAPGERIVEIRVAQELGVSQAPVREALRELESSRLVVSEPFRGARVRGVTAEELAEIYPVRAALEGVAAHDAAQRLRARDLARLAAEIEAMRAAATAGDVHAFIVHDVGFHRRIVEASGNSVLLELWRSLHVEVRTTITLIKRVADLLDVAETHRPVLDALRERDADAAARALRDHIERFADWVLPEETHVRQ
jgi:DNA-binding GntR family transcriptional regulator